MKPILIEVDQTELSRIASQVHSIKQSLPSNSSFFTDHYALSKVADGLHDIEMKLNDLIRDSSKRD